MSMMDLAKDLAKTLSDAELDKELADMLEEVRNAPETNHVHTTTLMVLAAETVARVPAKSGGSAGMRRAAVAVEAFEVLVQKMPELRVALGMRLEGEA